MIIGAPIPFTVPLGQIFSAPLPFSMTGYSGFRGEILVSLHITTSISCSLSISLETFETNTGVTHAIQSAAITAPLAVTTTIGVPRVSSFQVGVTSNFHCATQSALGSPDPGF
jgi:hypothetical protein